MSLNEILREDITWWKEFHGMSVTGLCDTDVNKTATSCVAVLNLKDGDV